jgi:hypothetical protein
MEVYQQTKKTFTKFGKQWGKSITEETATEALRQFFDNGTASLRTDIALSCIEQLKQIQLWFKYQTKLRYEHTLL